MRDRDPEVPGPVARLRALPPLVVLPVVVVLYYVAADFGLSLALVSSSASAVWPPTGIAIAAVLLLGLRAAPAVFVAALAANFPVSGGLLPSLAIAAGNTAEAVVAGELVRRHAGGLAAFARVSTVARFALFAGVAGPALSATVGTLALAAAGLVPQGSLAYVWTTWFLGDSGGALVVAPFLVLAFAGEPAGMFTRPYESAGLLTLGALLGLLLFYPASDVASASLPLGFLAFPVIVWAGYRFGPRGAASISLFLGVLVVAGTHSGLGPFVVGDPNKSLLLVQAFVSVMSLTGLAIGAAVREREKVKDELAAERSHLADRVRERTREVERARDELEEAQRLAQIGSWEWDVAADRVRWSAELFRMFGQDPATFVATYAGFLAAVHEDDRARVHAIVEKAFAEGGAFDLEHRIVRPDGTVRRLHGRGRSVPGQDGKTARMHGTAQDVTERREADAAYRASSERLRAVLQAASDGIVTSDSSGMIIDANPAAARIFGYGPGELHGRPLTDIMPERWRTPHREGFARHVRTGESRIIGSTLELEALRRDGQEVPIELSLSRWSVEDEPFFTAIVRDASDRRRAEAARSDGLLAQQEIAHLRAIDRFRTDFINTTAHELMTPLTPLRMQIHVLSNQLQGTKHERNVLVLERSLGRLTRLVQDILESGRVQAGSLGLRREAVDLGRIVADAAESYREAADARSIALDVEAEQGLVMDADPDRIAQIVDNLLSNALKFTTDGGAIRVGVARAGGRIEIRVRDSGRGLGPGEVERLFQPFGRLEAGGTGTGLGLYISKGIAELHGGSIRAESPGRGQGSTFVVELPVEFTDPPTDSSSGGSR